MQLGEMIARDWTPWWGWMVGGEARSEEEKSSYPIRKPGFDDLVKSVSQPQWNVHTINACTLVNSARLA